MIEGAGVAGIWGKGVVVGGLGVSPNSAVFVLVGMTVDACLSVTWGADAHDTTVKNIETKATPNVQDNLIERERRIICLLSKFGWGRVMECTFLSNLMYARNMCDHLADD